MDMLVVGIGYKTVVISFSVFASRDYKDVLSL